MILWTRVKVLTRETILNPIKTETNDKKWIEETMNKINGYLLILTKAWLLHSFYNHDYASKLLRQLNLQFLKVLKVFVVCGSNGSNIDRQDLFLYLYKLIWTCYIIFSPIISQTTAVPNRQVSKYVNDFPKEIGMKWVNDVLVTFAIFEDMQHLF